MEIPSQKAIDDGVEVPNVAAEALLDPQQLRKNRYGKTSRKESKSLYSVML